MAADALTWASPVDVPTWVNPADALTSANLVDDRMSGNPVDVPTWDNLVDVLVSPVDGLDSNPIARELDVPARVICRTS